MKNFRFQFGGKLFWQRTRFGPHVAVGWLFNLQFFNGIKQENCTFGVTQLVFLPISWPWLNMMLLISFCFNEIRSKWSIIRHVNFTMNIMIFNHVSNVEMRKLWMNSLCVLCHCNAACMCQKDAKLLPPNLWFKSSEMKRTRPFCSTCLNTELLKC